jgi:nucleoside-diphosphate-sugar epimerase
MPVVVTGADQPLARAVVEALLAGEAVEVRATVRDRGAVLALGALGVPAAVTDLADGLRFGAVLEGAHTVIHLDDPLGTWELLLDAAEETGLRRIVTVLEPAAAIPDAGPYDLVVVRTKDHRPRRELVAALVSADLRRQVHGVEVVDR